jgi:urease alpha subunit
MSGKVFAPTERLTLDHALRAVTIDAAYGIGMDSELGSIEAGKLADFAVLDEDPYAVGVVDRLSSFARSGADGAGRASASPPLAQSPSVKSSRLSTSRSMKLRTFGDSCFLLT